MGLSAMYLYTPGFLCGQQRWPLKPGCSARPTRSIPSNNPMTAPLSPATTAGKAGNPARALSLPRSVL